MPRHMRVLGAGLDPKTGIFLSVEKPSGLPLERIYMNPTDAIRVTRALLAALQQVEEARTLKERRAS